MSDLVRKSQHALVSSSGSKQAIGMGMAGIGGGSLAVLTASAIFGTFFTVLMLISLVVGVALVLKK